MTLDVRNFGNKTMFIFMSLFLQGCPLGKQPDSENPPVTSTSDPVTDSTSSTTSTGNKASGSSSSGGDSSTTSGNGSNNSGSNSSSGIFRENSVTNPSGFYLMSLVSDSVGTKNIFAFHTIVGNTSTLIENGFTAGTFESAGIGDVIRMPDNTFQAVLSSGKGACCSDLLGGTVTANSLGIGKWIDHVFDNTEWRSVGPQDAMVLPNGDWLLMYNHYHTQSSGIITDINGMFAYSGNSSGRTLEVIQTSNDPNDQFRNGRFGKTSTGLARAGYQRFNFNGVPRKIFINERSAAGAWGTPVELTHSGCSNFILQGFDVGSNDVNHYLYSCNDGAQVQDYYCISSGASCDSAQVVNTTSKSPLMFLDSNNKIHIIQPGSPGVEYKTNANGASLSTANSLSINSSFTHYSYLTSPFVDASNNVHFGYIVSDGNDHHVCYAKGATTDGTILTEMVLKSYTTDTISNTVFYRMPWIGKRIHPLP